MPSDIIRCRFSEISQYIDIDNNPHWHRYYQATLDVARPDAVCHIIDKQILVLEPDFLIDVSSLSECFKPYGIHPMQYLLERISPAPQGTPLLLGNIVNLFLDEWVHNESPDYTETMRKAFKMYPLQLAADATLKDKDAARQFASDCTMHFNNVKTIVTNQLTNTTYSLDKNKAILEPSFICPQLGLQGRLDYMQEDMHALIEMKSGHADEYSHKPGILAAQNHEVQMQLYQAILHYGQDVPYDLIHPYLLYTKYPILYASQGDMHLTHVALNLRNQIVALIYQLAFANSLEEVAAILNKLSPEVLNSYNRKDRFWTQYVLPSILEVVDPLRNLSNLESSYYYALIRFIMREMWLSKVGYQGKEGLSGGAVLWLATLEEKIEMGCILHDIVLENQSRHDGEHAEVSFKLANISTPINFRVGDLVLFYRSDEQERACAHRQQVIRGHIQSISQTAITLSLRAPQHEHFLLDSSARFTMELDSMDSAYHSMLRGLYAFTVTDKRRRDLLLGLRAPEFDSCTMEMAENYTDCFDRMAMKTLAAKDYFLLIGPPGTGKTSCALKRMVEVHYAEPERQILLLAYTNRAVDEICGAVAEINPTISYTRVGNEVACAPTYRANLLSKQIADLNTREAVNNFLSKQRVFVGTVASVTNKPELFALKSFDIAIIDEATQILEPQLLPLLCARSSDNKMGIKCFVMIGDYKQLPAIVIQDEDESGIHNDELNRIGIANFRLSLFERLYRQQTNNQAVDILVRHGRMHPDIAAFPNRYFYNNQLVPVGLQHQQEVLTSFDNKNGASDQDPWFSLLYRRTTFIPCECEKDFVKYNQSEAKNIGRLLQLLYNHLGHFTSSTIGIIASYRAQITLIYETISSLEIPLLDAQNIMIDTVERFQGSQRDIILYSISANTQAQMAMLSNLVEDRGQLIDRKLNVALTRARKQLYVFGVSSVLETVPCYKELINEDSYKVSDKIFF